MKRDAEDKLFCIVSDVLGVPIESINNDSSPDTIGSWDSLSHINLMISLEAEFAVTLSPQDMMEMLSVRLIRSILVKQGVKDFN